MKAFLFTLVVLTQTTVFAAIKNQVCQSKAELKKEMTVISSNIANINTTRTPEGGPYKRQTYVCTNGECNIVYGTGYISKYEPTHPDADQEGYVKYPDINLETEMQNMITATRAYEKASDTCPLKSDDACERAQEKKATYKFLIKKLSNGPGANMGALINEIRKNSVAYKELNAQCKK